MAGSYETIIKAVEQFLKDTGSQGPDRSKSTREVISALREKIAAGELDVDVGDGASNSSARRPTKMKIQALSLADRTEDIDMI